MDFCISAIPLAHSASKNVTSLVSDIALPLKMLNSALFAEYTPISHSNLMYPSFAINRF